MFSEKALFNSPSNEISFESYKTTNLLNLLCPANEAASCDIPSIKSPSEANTYV
ncbi:Uncharacterised protein [Staphylococcus aureus]|nr:Uncharacterised protein [Staphylococcus aureus]